VHFPRNVEGACVRPRTAGRVVNLGGLQNLAGTTKASLSAQASPMANSAARARAVNAAVSARSFLCAVFSNSFLIRIEIVIQSRPGWRIERRLSSLEWTGRKSHCAELRFKQTNRVFANLIARSAKGLSH
jgi:hypothetical protein